MGGSKGLTTIPPSTCIHLKNDLNNHQMKFDLALRAYDKARGGHASGMTFRLTQSGTGHRPLLTALSLTRPVPRAVFRMIFFWRR